MQEVNIIWDICYSIIIYVIGTALINRIFFFKRVNVYFRIALLGFLSIPLLMSLAAFQKFNLENAFFVSFMHLLIGFLFSQFICLPDRSITLRFLVEIFEEREKGITLKELNNKFNLERMVQSRLIQLQNGGVLNVDNFDNIQLSSKGILIGNLIVKGRKFFDIKSAN